MLKLEHPSTILISGPTGCGKTQFVSKLITERMWDSHPERIVWLYSEWQQLYDILEKRNLNIEFVDRLVGDELYDSLKPGTRNLLILDDQMSQLGDSKVLSKLFTKGSSRRNLTVIYIVQNLFDKGKSHRVASINSHYLVLFKNPRDNSQIKILAQQMFPNKKGLFLVESFQDATWDPYGYLMIDYKSTTPEDFRLRTNIFPNEKHLVYQQSN